MWIQPWGMLHCCMSNVLMLQKNMWEHVTTCYEGCAAVSQSTQPLTSAHKFRALTLVHCLNHSPNLSHVFAPGVCKGSSGHPGGGVGELHARSDPKMLGSDPKILSSTLCFFGFNPKPKKGLDLPPRGSARTKRPTCTLSKRKLGAELGKFSVSQWAYIHTYAICIPPYLSISSKFIWISALPFHLCLLVRILCCCCC